MNLKDVIRILKNNLGLLIVFPILLAALVYYMTGKQPKEYTSSALIYTGIGSGYTILSEDMSRLDNNVVNNTFDNLLTTLTARETIEEVAIRLLASHLMLEKADPKVLSEENFIHLKELFPQNLREQYVDKNSMEQTIKNLRVAYNSLQPNKVKNLLNSDQGLYSISRLKYVVEAERKNYSDMMEIWFVSNDPGISYNVLQILSDVFIAKYQDLKMGEIRRVVTYFTEQTARARHDLGLAEDRLRQFGVENKIINYDEQTRSVSGAKEALLADIKQQEMELSSAEAAIANLDEKIGMRAGLLETNNRVTAKRKELSDVNYQIANSGMYKDDPEKLARLKKQAEELKKEIQGLVNDLYALNNSKEGMPKNNLLEQWLANVLKADESKARLQVLNKRLQDYDKEFTSLAPLGATLHALERDVNIAEEEYMHLLNALNTNKQRQKNIEMASNVRVVDKPYYPLKPNASKQMMLVIGAFIGGLTLLSSVFIGKELLDGRIKTPSVAEKQTGLLLAGVMPEIRGKRSNAYLRYAEESLMEQTLSTMLLNLAEDPKEEYPKIITVCSTRVNEGKTWSTIRLADKLSEVDGPVLLMHPQTENGHDNAMMYESLSLDITTLEIKEYEVKNDFAKCPDPSGLLCSRPEKFKDFRYIIIEVPPLAENKLPLFLVKKSDMVLLVVDSTREWTETDKYISNLLKKASGREPLLLLNKVAPERLEEILGGIPRQHKKTKKVAKKKKGTDKVA
ncbi:MAG: GNVR domain-containing protein [Cytophagaceae bacterium]